VFHRPTDSTLRGATIVVLVVAALLRLALATINRDSSDNHVDVITTMAFENRIPEYDRDRDRVKEAFQPKLYHGTVAALLKIDPFDMESGPCLYEFPVSPHVILIGQMVSAVAGILTLFVVLRFLGLVELSDKTRFFAFSLVALNPALVAINVQVTNDSFDILFGSLSLYWGYRFFRDFRPTDFLWMTAAAIATAMSKATGLPVCLAITLVFAITLARTPAEKTPARMTVLRYAIVFVVALLSWFTIIAPKPGAYWEQYRRYGSPFATNRLPEPFPRLFEHTMFTGDPGVRSIAESLFTFRIIGLLEDPILLDHDRDHFPLHRTSLWSQLYGRLNSIRFEHLPSWRPHSALVTNLPRLTFLVALFPMALLLLGAWRATTRVIADVGRVRPHEWLIAVSAAGYVAFLIALALRYRDYSFFKPIHAFAGLLAFLLPFGCACDRFYSEVDRRPGMRRMGDVLLGAVIVLYALDCTLLAVQLFASCRSA
jgi:hypothetical protein